MEDIPLGEEAQLPVSYTLWNGANAPSKIENEINCKPQTRFIAKSFKFLYRLLPSKWSSKDMEEGTKSPRIIIWMKRWWLFYGRLFYLSLIITALLFVISKAISNWIRNDVVTPIYLDNQGKPIHNVQTVFSFFDDTQTWIKGISMKDALNSFLTEEEIERGYFTSNIRDKETKNCTLSILHASLKLYCLKTKCRCISFAYLGIPKNVVLLKTDMLDSNTEMFMINPRIVDRSEKSIRVAYQRPNSNHHELHNIENWVYRPAYITLEYKNEENKKLRKLLDIKASACMYELLKWTQE